MKGEYKKCDLCDEQVAIVRVTTTTLEGSVLDSGVYCRDCFPSATQNQSIGDGPLPSMDDPNQEP